MPNHFIISTPLNHIPISPAIVQTDIPA